MPYFATAKEMERLDALAVENGLAIMQMMELAGWRMAQLFALLKIPKSAHVAILCGKGNNGGDGLSAARFLLNDGRNISVILAETGLRADAAHHARLLKKMGVPILPFKKETARAEIFKEHSDYENPSAVPEEAAAERFITEADVIVDALLGYHLSGNPRRPYDRIIDLVNAASGTVISYDLPSGIDGTTGDCFEPCVRADVTLTLALPKKAFRTRRGKEKAGRTYIGDIGIPAFLYNAIKKDSRPHFADGLCAL